MSAHYAFDQVLAWVEQVLNSGPDKVMITAEGLTRSPKKAYSIHSTWPDVVYIRQDGWSLGCPSLIEQQAYETWKNEWVARVDLHTGEWLPMF